MIQLILHAIGDYLLQTSTQALNKKNKGWFGFKMCFIHCITYSIPFFLIGTPTQVFFIFATHFLIDRTKIVSYFIAIRDRNITDQSISYFNIKDRYDISNAGFIKTRPAFISIWLNIIIDNIFHIICNYTALTYL